MKVHGEPRPQERRRRVQVLEEALRFVEDEIHQTAERTLSAVPPGPKRLEALLRLNLPEGSGDPRWMLWLESWTLAPHDPHVAGLTSQLDHRWIGLFAGLAVQVVTGSHGRTPHSALRACLEAAATELGFRPPRG